MILIWFPTPPNKAMSICIHRNLCAIPRIDAWFLVILSPTSCQFELLCRCFLSFALLSFQVDYGVLHTFWDGCFIFSKFSHKSKPLRSYIKPNKWKKKKHGVNKKTTTVQSSWEMLVFVSTLKPMIIHFDFNNRYSFHRRLHFVIILLFLQRSWMKCLLFFVLSMLANRQKITHYWSAQ